MTRLLQHMPAHVHLILTTRADPPLPLERLRGRQQLAEIRSADLSFTPEEARQLLRQILGETATDETAALLEESTEGWPVGLQLAAISLRGRSNPAAFARKIAQGGHRLVADYLLAEVLEVLPDALRTYLLQTSLLDRFCAPLCDAVRGEACQELTGEDFLALCSGPTSSSCPSTTRERGSVTIIFSSICCATGCGRCHDCRDDGHARPRKRLVRSPWPV